MRLLTILVLAMVVVAFIDARSFVSDKREIKPSEDAVSGHSTENPHGSIEDESEPNHNELPKRFLEKRRSRIAGLHL